MATELATAHRFFTPYSDQANIQKIVGLTGTYYSPKRAFGRSILDIARRGGKEHRPRIGRRRQTGKAIFGKQFLKKIGIG